MSQLPSIDEIKKKHEELYDKVLRDRSLRENTDIYSSFIQDVDVLLRNISDLSTVVQSLDDYRWLSDVAIKWQLVFASIFNLAKTIQISPPSPNLVPPIPPSTALSEEEINYWVARNAEYFGFSRIAQTGLPGHEKEMKEDWQLATIFLASDILDGKINFANRISPTSYYRLEETWVRDVKRLRAYFRWERIGKRFGQEYALEDYYEACKYLRDRLVDPGIKALPTEFGKAKEYIEFRYLTNGLISMDKSNTVELIRKKAERIMQETGEIDPLKNWVSAETYVRMFYENIIPAVVEDNIENVLTVLKAFQFSKAPENGYHVINCFETALAIYFLSAEKIKKLWDDSEKKPRPQSSVESKFFIESWPQQFKIPQECKNCFSFDAKSIKFKGVMTELQKKTLIEKVNNNVKFLSAIEELFIQSRLIHKDTTL